MRRGLLWALAGAAATIFAVAWFAPARDYLYVPNKATPVADKVDVPGEKPDAGEGGIYYVDVTIRRATWAERLLPFLRPDGATLVPQSEVVPPGSCFQARHEDGLKEMARSEEVAAAVALRAAGYEVRTDARGALVEAVATDAPAAAKLRSGDVIVAGAGTGNPHARAAAPPVRGGPARRRRRPSGAPRREDADPHGPHRRVAQSARTRDHRDPRRPGRDIELPVKVKINLGGVGGPSAGLPFALDVLQELGTDVDKGRRVVATGEIALDGTVGPIGGVKQKTFGARRAHADVFLVPAGENAAEARRYAGNLRIIPVESFQQALSALRTLPPA